MTVHQRGWPWFAEASSTYSLRHMNACIPVLFRLVIQNSYYPRVSFALSYFIIYIQIPFSLSRLSISSWTQFYHVWNTVFIFRYGHLTIHISVTNTCISNTLWGCWGVLYIKNWGLWDYFSPKTYQNSNTDGLIFKILKEHVRETPTEQELWPHMFTYHSSSNTWKLVTFMADHSSEHGFALHKGVFQFMSEAPL